MQMNISRRSFLQSAALFGASSFALNSFGASIFTGKAGDFDDSLMVFLSDVHVRGGKSYQRDNFEPMVAEILKMNPLPRNIVVFGDLAYLCGNKEDYVESEKLIRLFTNAGINVTIGMGNHDRRSTFLEVYPEYAKRLKVPGRIVSVASGADADILMLDGLQGTDDRKMNDMGPVSGQLCEAQREWLKAELPKWPRKVFVASHFPLEELKMGAKESLAKFMNSECPNVEGYIHGHNHRWYNYWTALGWKSRKLIRSACLPSTGHWGDIGYATFRTTSKKAELKLVQKDFFFPKPLDVKAGEKRPAEWDAIIEEHRRNSTVTFDFG
jgi:hypothetical protein